MTRQTIFPALHYRDPDAALTFLADAFGASEHAVHRDGNGRIAHAEVTIEGNVVMFGGTPTVEIGPTTASPAASAQPPVTLYVVVTDPDAHCARARAAGAEILREPQEMPYGAREYGARDSEGNRWSFGTYDPDDPPA